VIAAEIHMIKDWMQDVEIDEKTCIPHCYAGDRMDWDMAVGNLFQSPENVG